MGLPGRLVRGVAVARSRDVAERWSGKLAPDPWSMWLCKSRQERCAGDEIGIDRAGVDPHCSLCPGSRLPDRSTTPVETQRGVGDADMTA